MDASHQNLNWSRTYWAILVNQVVVVGIVALLASALLRESYRACEAATLYFPGFTSWYFVTVGPMGLVLAALFSVAISLAAIRLRRRFASVLITSLSFVGCVVFLAGGMFSSIAPLLVAIRDMLPPDQRW